MIGIFICLTIGECDHFYFQPSSSVELSSNSIEKKKDIWNHEKNIQFNIDVIICDYFIARSNKVCNQASGKAFSHNELSSRLPQFMCMNRKVKYWCNYTTENKPIVKRSKHQAVYRFRRFMCT